jgi:pyruvate/2-oxoglutarate/acetoin dehydrogenase E1 component
MVMTFAEALAAAQREEMTRDNQIYVSGEDVGYYDGAFFATKGLYKEFGPERVIDMPISEAAIIGSAFGAALSGMRPVVEIQYLEFLDYIDPLVNHIAKTHLMSGGKIKVPMVIRLPSGGKGGNAAPHSQNLEAWFVHIPGVYVVMPSSANDAKGLLKSAIRDDNPVVFIEEKRLYFMQGEVEEKEDHLIPLGEAKIVKEGKDVTIIALGWMVSRALNAARQLEKEGISVEIVDPRTLNPLDKSTICESVKKTGKVIVTHQACKTGGVGAEVAALVMEEAFEYLDAPVKRIGALDAPIAYSLNLERLALPTDGHIVAGVKELLAG